MAVRAAIATGNFLTAGTWGLVDSTSYNNTETTTTALTTSYQTSSTFTPGAITIDGIAVKLSVRTGTTGTMTVALDNATVDVAGTVVTINTADLPAAATADLNGGWIFFKFSAPVTLLGATAYGVKAKTSSSSQVSLFSTATTNWARYLRTTTTGAPAAGDDLIITGIHTTTGSPAAVVVTMDETATTDYGAASTSLVTPSLAIGNSGSLTFGTTASTNYYLRQSGNVIVYSGGTLNTGTTGTACPRNSTMSLNFDCGANVDFGLTVRNLGTWNSQGLSRTSGKNIFYCKLNTDEAIASTSLGVDTDTGWLDNDVIAVASTTRTVGDCEAGTLNGNAGASTLTVDGFAGAGGGLAVAHSGTSPTQAEVILLTRNVVIFGASNSLQGYISIGATATVDIDWTEIKWMGSATAGKRGMDVASTTGSFSIQFSSLHDFVVASSIGVNFTGTTGSSWVFSNNVTFNIVGLNISVAGTSGTTWTMDTNIFMYAPTALANISLADVGGTFTNNTIVSLGTGNQSLSLQETNGVMGTFSNIVIHSSGGIGFQGGANGMSGTISTMTVWRCGSNGFSAGVNWLDLTITSLTLFGNSTANIVLGSALTKLTLISPVLSGDSTFATTNGIQFSVTNVITAEVVIYGGDFGTATGINVAHTNDINISANNFVRIFLNNTKLASATEVLTQSNMTESSFVSSEKHDQTAGLHKSWKKYGTITIETGTVHTGSQSVKLTPNNASKKLQSPSFFAAVASGATVTPTVYVYEDGTYNGNRARLIVKRNDAIGITSDTVLATHVGVHDATWESMSSATIAATDDGVMEFVVDCDGTAGNVYVDSISVA